MAELDKQLNKCMKEEAFVLQSLKVKSYWSLRADNLPFSCVIFYLYYNGIKTFHILQTARRIKVVK